MDAVLIPPTIPEMVAAYDQATKQICAAYDALAQAEKMLNDVFGGQYSNFSTLSRNTWRHDNARDDVLGQIKRSAWRRFVEKVELRKVLSVKDAEKLDEQLERGELLDVTVENVMDTLKFLLGNTTDFARDAMVEVFELLRPRASKYKTNPKYEIKKRVIEPWVEGTPYGNHPFRVMYYREKDVIAVDRVFHLLDGAGVPKGYRSPLVDAINTSEDGTGATPYFRFHCYYNGNLHLDFLRADLVGELNRIGGEGRLRGE